ncbi:hypothetical protein [Cognatiluteimonas profundi]|uniref:hypothetical protein n=1 Tax=Cognatiluteimonas profundi TaxID=2594501 RepID=UPI00131E8900|nr:hypothetical protein [Lysobacter profundi]
MNRKLHHTVMALSATATVFTVLLLAASPVGPASQTIDTGSTPSLVTDASAVAVGAADAIQDSANQRRHLRHSRALLALPYFSFAQGLRRNRS